MKRKRRQGNVETLQLWSERMLASGAIDEDAYNKRKL